MRRDGAGGGKLCAACRRAGRGCPGRAGRAQGAPRGLVNLDALKEEVTRLEAERDKACSGLTEVQPHFGDRDALKTEVAALSDDVNSGSRSWRRKAKCKLSVSARKLSVEQDAPKSEEEEATACLVTEKAEHLRAKL